MKNNNNTKEKISHNKMKCGIVAIIGAPNAGKSTLINHFVGSKISIVTHKEQTTRSRLRGITIIDNSQIIFVDTPGIFNPNTSLDKAMVAEAWGGANDADTTILLIDAKKAITENVKKICDKLDNNKLETILVFNKIDLISKEKLLELTSQIHKLAKFKETFMISAKTGNGTKQLGNYLAENVLYGPWLYPEEQMADAPLLFMAAEITREKLFLRLHEELPYASTVETENWERLKNGSVKVTQIIYVERESQRKIVLGKGGQTIKDIGSKARHEISKLINNKAHLFLFVKVKQNWHSDPDRLNWFGLQ